MNKLFVRSSVLLTVVVMSVTGICFAQEYGSVLETLDAGQYTYVHVFPEQGSNVWYAVPSTQMETGTKVVLPTDGLPMRSFYSKSLDRTFEMVYFVGGIQKAGQTDLPAGHPPVGEQSSNLPAGHPPVGEQSSNLPAGHPPVGQQSSETTETYSFDKLEKPESALTISELYRDQDRLANQQVVVHGIAVKTADNILGRNWVHLQDGTGETGADDLVITTTDVVAKGAVVTVRGILRQNMDFGSGYRYAVLLEDAQVQF